jgi:hypothetical protein
MASGPSRWSYAEGKIALFCYSIFGGKTCMTPTGFTTLYVTQKRVAS